MSSVVSDCPGYPPSAVLHGYLMRRTFRNTWVRYWCVIQGGCLYCYLTPDDHVSVDVTELNGYSVTSQENVFSEQRFVLYLEHKDYIPVYLSASCKKEMGEWKTSLTSAALMNVSQTNRQTPPSQTDGDSPGGGEGGNRPEAEVRALVIKQKLLTEVLRQTQQLERKQTSRKISAKQQTPPRSASDTEVPAALPTSPPAVCPQPTPIPTTNAQPTAGEQICTRTRLRQRRMSAQIKLDTLQRQMQTSNGPSKKSIFSFVKKKSSSTSSSGATSGEDSSAPHSSDIVRQLKVLSDHLSAIDRDLVLSRGVLFVDNKMMTTYPITSASSESRLALNRSNSNHSRRSSNGSDCRVPITTSAGGGSAASVESSSGEGSGSGNGSGNGGIMRSNSLKSSMQKLAHKTFAKAGWYRSKKSSQGDAPAPALASAVADKEDVTPAGLVYDVNTPPDVIDLSHRLRRTRSARDMFLVESGGGLVGRDGRGGGGVGSEGFLPPPSPFKGSPTLLSSCSSPPPRSVGSMGSVSSEGGGRRHSSSGSWRSVYDDPKSPPHLRQGVDPAAIAHIEAFEDMTRQILGESAS